MNLTNTEKTQEAPPIRLQIPGTEKYFYSLLKEEVIYINGAENREEEKSTIHLAIRPSGNPKFHQLHVEIFDRYYRSIRLSQSDRNLKNKLMQPLSNVRFIINAGGDISSIDNLREIQETQRRISKKLSETVIAANYFQKLAPIYKSEKRISSLLHRYDNLGMLLYPFYKRQNRQVRYTNLMKNTLLNVEEHPTEPISADKQTAIEIQGKIVFPDSTAMFRTVSNILNIPYKQEDIPVLNSYEGVYILDERTGRVKQSRFLVDFSFGENYRKSLHYQLKQISHEEI